MPRYKLILEYDGAPFVGWQRQENGLSVQEVLEGALFAMSGARVTAHGAGRTDAGVHARGQVAHVDLERDWSPFRLSEGLNALCKPHPVAVLSAEHRHRMGLNERVEPLAKTKRRPVTLKVDMRNLPPRMHAGVRAPGAVSGHACAVHREQSALQNLLHRKAVLLPLPADERRAVIFEDKLKTRHSKPGRTHGGERRRWLRRGPRRRAARRSGRH